MPVLEITGNMALESKEGRVVMPNILGMLGPVISASRIPTSKPARRRATAVKPLTSDLPTPPLPLITAMILPKVLTSLGALSTNSIFISRVLSSLATALRISFWIFT